MEISNKNQRGTLLETSPALENEKAQLQANFTGSFKKHLYCIQHSEKNIWIL